MASLEIEGGIPLQGEAKISGAKNEALKLIAAALLLPHPLRIKNCPEIADVTALAEIVKALGGSYSLANNVLDLDATGVKSAEVPYEPACRLRASIVLLGPLLARFGAVESPYPGGCLIGARSLETHFRVFEALGAKIQRGRDNFTISLDKVKNTSVTLDEASVTATENVALFAAGQKQPIRIENCAIEPEVVELLKFLAAAGAKISGIGTRQIEVSGNSSLMCKEIEVMPDRIEAGTFVIALIATGGAGTVKPYPKEHLQAFNKILLDCGAKIVLNDNEAKVFKIDGLRPFKVETGVHPGFPTDLQSPIALLAARAKGTSEINETLYENRLGYLKELQAMGLKVEFVGAHKAKISGPATLLPREIHSLDLRSGITLVIAALMTPGKSIIRNAEMIDRGYEKLPEKLKTLGARVRRIDD